VSDPLHVVTGAFGYSGSYIARRLLDAGCRVRNLTGHPDRPHPLGRQVESVAFHFDDPAALAAALRGARVLYNTYWVRFARGRVTHERAVANSRVLISAAAEAGVGRIVHISIANPSDGSPFPYYRGKAAVERALIESGLSHAIIRPTVLFGGADILINNIAWMLRRLPLFGVFGAGDYHIQPVYVGDLADLAVRLGGRDDNVIADAVGPETYTFEELVRLIAERIGSRPRIVHISPALALLAARVLAWRVRDVIITRDEIGGLMANLLVSHQPPTCPTRFSEWLKQHADELGIEYRSELARHFGNE
jgi:uncharacterized protein YbjT (DUF2867 family)